MTMQRQFQSPRHLGLRLEKHDLPNVLYCCNDMVLGITMIANSAGLRRMACCSNFRFSCPLVKIVMVALLSTVLQHSKCHKARIGLRMVFTPWA